MAEINENWEPTCNRFIAFLDIMGFKDRIYREKHEDIYELLMKLRPTIELIKDREKRREKRDDISNTPFLDYVTSAETRVISFSDSIILVSKDKSKDSLKTILVWVSMIVSNALNVGIPIKGAIAFGLQTADRDNELYFGKPLVDAFLLQEELYLYGVVLHHTMDQYLTTKETTDQQYNREENNIIKYLVPFKSGNITHYIVDWLPLLEAGKDPVNVVSSLYNTVSGKPRIYVDNTIVFISRAIDEKKRKE